MDYQTLYETEKKKREAAEARVAELQGVVRGTREDEHLVAALRRAGVPEVAAKDAASAMRRKASIAFDEKSGAIDFGEIDGRTYYDPAELAHAFLATSPHFAAEHVEATTSTTSPAQAASTNGAPETFTAGEEWKNLDAPAMAELAWRDPPKPPPPGPDPFAEFLEGRS